MKSSLANRKTKFDVYDSQSTQLWKMYQRAKTSLPYRERMENLTWRMMALNIIKSRSKKKPNSTTQKTNITTLTNDNIKTDPSSEDFDYVAHIKKIGSENYPSSSVNNNTRSSNLSNLFSTSTPTSTSTLVNSGFQFALDPMVIEGFEQPPSNINNNQFISNSNVNPMNIYSPYPDKDADKDILNYPNNNQNPTYNGLSNKSSSSTITLNNNNNSNININSNPSSLSNSAHFTNFGSIDSMGAQSDWDTTPIQLSKSKFLQQQQSSMLFSNIDPQVIVQQLKQGNLDQQPQQLLNLNDENLLDNMNLNLPLSLPISTIDIPSTQLTTTNTMNFNRLQTQIPTPIHQITLDSFNLPNDIIMSDINQPSGINESSNINMKINNTNSSSVSRKNSIISKKLRNHSITKIRSNSSTNLLTRKSISSQTKNRLNSSSSSPNLNQNQNNSNSNSPNTSIDKSMQSPPTECYNCHTTTTPLWRRDPDGQSLCNACGLFLKLHGVVRPLSLKTDVVKRRNRGGNNNNLISTSSNNNNNKGNLIKGNNQRNASLSIAIANISGNDKSNSNSNVIINKRRNSLIKSKITSATLSPITNDSIFSVTSNSFDSSKSNFNNNGSNNPSPLSMMSPSSLYPYNYQNNNLDIIGDSNINTISNSNSITNGNGNGNSTFKQNNSKNKYHSNDNDNNDTDMKIDKKFEIIDEDMVMDGNKWDWLTMAL